MSQLKEKGRQVWGKVTSGLESGANQAQAELSKLQAQAAGASDASKARIRAKIGEAQAKQEAEEEKLRSSLTTEITDADAQISDLEAAATGVSGEARERIVRDADQVRAERDKARQKLVTSLEAELAEAQNEMETLQEAAADAPADAAARIMMRAEWARARLDAVQSSLQAVQQRSAV